MLTGELRSKILYDVSSIERNRSALQRHLTSLNVLFSSLQSRAFLGKL
jgi:hypothetical protein